MRRLVGDKSAPLDDQVCARNAVWPEERPQLAPYFGSVISGVDHDIVVAAAFAQMSDKREHAAHLVERFEAAEDDGMRDWVLQITGDDFVVGDMYWFYIGELAVLANRFPAFFVAFE